MANYIKSYDVLLDGIKISSITVPGDYDKHNILSSVTSNPSVISKISGKQISAIIPDTNNNAIRIYTHKRKSPK